MRTIIFIFLAVSLFACNNSDFQEHETGLQYRFIQENTEAQTPNLGDGLVLQLKYTSAEDSVIYEGPFRMVLKEASHKGGSIEDAFALMHKGDSAEFLITAKDFINHTIGADKFPEFVDRNSKMKFYIRLKDILSPEDMTRMEMERNIELKAAENMLLDDYISRNKIEIAPTESGMYIIQKGKGKGKAIKINDKVTVHYTGMFLDETIFDSSRKRNEAFVFTLGAEQVIAAWDEALLGLKVGDKIRLITPSRMAYDKKGYGQLIPAYTSLIFDIEVISIN